MRVSEVQEGAFEQPQHLSPILDNEQIRTTNLVYHVRQQTLHLITIHRLFTPNTNRSAELRDWNSRSPGCGRSRVFRFLKPTCNKDFSEEVAKRDVATAFEREVDASFDEFVFASYKGGVEAR
jgi:hypothetical protein